MNEPQVAVFFYGSYMNLRVLAEVHVIPSHVETAKLSGFDIEIRPLANLVRSDGRCVYGLLTTATHAELDRLYAHARNVLGGTYLPHPVVVETQDGKVTPALCYIAASLEVASASNGYIDRIVKPARDHGFPTHYIERLENFRP
jgi:AIG2 family protein